MNSKSLRISLFIFFALLAAGLIGCSIETEPPPSPSNTIPPATLTFTATSVPPSATFTETPPTETATPSPTDTLTPLPTNTSTATPTETPTPTATKKPSTSSGPGFGGAPGTVLVYFIHKGTGGSLCGTDSLVAVPSGVTETRSIEKNVKQGLNKLFSYKSQWMGDFYNPLYRSRIKASRVEFDPKSGVMAVYLRGNYVPPEDVCDNSRVRWQVWSTIRQYKEVKDLTVYLNSGLFGDILARLK